MRSIKQANVVLLPLPAGPLTKIIPFLRSERFKTDSGIFKSSGFGRSKLTTRNTAASEFL